MDSWNRCKAVLLLLACALLTACGGGGGTEGQANADTGDGTVAGLLAAPITEAQAVRFLWKSSFGPTTESIARLRQLGYARFVDEQLGLATGTYSDYLLDKWAPNAGNVEFKFCETTYPNESAGRCYDWIYNRGRAPSIIFLRSAVHDADQLRLRMAFALSQMLVVSVNSDERHAYGMRSYQQMLRQNAFGNYRDILVKVTKHPYMGAWLNLGGSHASRPNENYPRELLQLFSVGTFLMNQDGTYVLNAQGRRIETYKQAHIEAFSKALTGWVFPPGFYSSEAMVVDESRHDKTPKILLNGQVIPAGTSAQQDLETVISNVFNHPNTGPFVVKQLIQFLVTSNPSPAYVARVVRVFNNNGQGVRGDMRAVVRAILLDSEALSPPDNAGRLLEPVLTMTGLVRAIGGTTDGAYLDQAAAAMQQRPFAAPSVFNFYPPDFALPLAGSKLVAPQFGILTMSTLTQRLEHAQNFLWAGSIPAEAGLPVGYARGTRLQWPAAWLQMAAGQAAPLVEMLNVRLTGGTLTAAQKNHIAAQVQSLPATTEAQRLERLRLATFLVYSSPQFMTHR
ncbi:DUF1800 domain-containing protein [Limnohabitans radicicola]|uniref:DUF1800 domain-containing protein n=1 Tax=Limnohabitans radicicola TaxID=2771427 RepID=A0A927FJQ9_9BURK|nr:DUF1800 domain-containing protein [Limnohabitans radicicola]MBD8052031.1 DUF1800 domain-containing protein [Limnohabitans radicicola]